MFRKTLLKTNAAVRVLQWEETGINPEFFEEKRGFVAKKENRVYCVETSGQKKDCS